MSIFKQVTISAAVGKQVIAADAKARLHQMILIPSAVSAAVMVVRDGNASGDVIGSMNVAANTPFRIPVQQENGIPLGRGVHCKITGTGAVGYLELN